MKIDLMGSVAPNDAEIEAGMQEEINATWPPSKREKVLRTGVGKDALDAFFVDMSAMKVQMIADRNLLADTIRYEQADARLAMAALDPNAKDDEGNLIYPLDENGVNAVIEADKGERLVAQETVDNASFEVLSLAAQRKGE